MLVNTTMSTTQSDYDHHKEEFEEAELNIFQ